jgi:hypothetical protein
MARAARCACTLETLMPIRTLLLLTLLAFAAGTTTASAERRVALVIGNSAYENAAVLRNPRNDASDMAQELRKVGFEVQLGLDLDQQHFAQSIEQFARAMDGADVALFYYAGHGLQMNDRNYLVSVNAKLQNEFLLTSETIDLEAIVRLMESKSPVNLVFLDACRNNPLADNLRQNLASTKRSASLGRGLARIEPSGRDTLIAYAAAPGQVAVDGQGRNSPFTSSLLKNMDRPGLEVSVMLKEVASDVRRETQNTQRPQQLSDMARTFYFTRADTPAQPQPAPAPAPAPRAVVAQNDDDKTVDVAFWNSVQAAKDCDAVQAYLRRFPNGVFVDLAKLSERRLCVSDRQVTIIEHSPPPGQAPALPSLALPPAPPPVIAPPPPVVAAPPPAPEPAAPQVAALPPPMQPPPEDLGRNIGYELERLGCISSADDKWSAATGDAIRRYNRYAKASLDPETPSPDTLSALHDASGRVCPLICKRGFRAEDDECVAIGRPNQRPKAVSRRPERPEHTARPERTEPREPRKPREPSGTAAAAPSGGGANGKCESRMMVNGKWCCSYDPPYGPTVLVCR